MEDRKCLVCETPIKGRRDKKFCSDQCRNEYHNLKNSQELVYVKEINGILKKNRQILNDINPGEKSRCKREELLKRGFDFTYFTNTYTTKNGGVYYFVYEQGYIQLDDGSVAIVRKKDYVK